MSDQREPESLDELGAKLKRARESSRHGRPDGAQSGRANPPTYALGMRVALEMVAAFIAGGAIGWYLDKWLGTSPWMLIVWVALGFAAGIRSAYRVAQQATRDAEDKNNAGGGKPPGDEK
jgi:ATP synthase protein I